MAKLVGQRAIVAGLILLAVFFVYLSYTENEPTTVAEMLSEDLEAETVASVMQAEQTDLLEIFDNEDEFFIEYRLERDRQRAKKIELLQTVLNAPDGDEGIRATAQQELLQITRAYDQELTLETLIMAKGYTDVVAFVQPDSITIVVQDSDFKEEEMIKIGDLVSRTTGISLAKVTIFAKK